MHTNKSNLWQKGVLVGREEGAGLAVLFLSVCSAVAAVMKILHTLGAFLFDIGSLGVVVAIVPGIILFVLLRDEWVIEAALYTLAISLICISVGGLLLGLTNSFNESWLGKFVYQMDGVNQVRLDTEAKITQTGRDAVLIAVQAAPVPNKELIVQGINTTFQAQDVAEQLGGVGSMAHIYPAPLLPEPP